MSAPAHMKLVTEDEPVVRDDAAARDSDALTIPAADVSPPKKRKNSGGKTFLVLVLLIAGGAGTWWYLDHKSLNDTVSSVASTVGLTSEPAPLQLAAIEVAMLKPQTLTSTIRVSGALAPTGSTTVNAEIGARIESITIESGDRVEQGQIIATLATTDLQSALDERLASLDAARSQVEFADSGLGKIETLAKKGYATKSTLEKSRNDLQAARASLSSAQSQVALAQSALADAVIRSPIAGVVSERMVNPGEAVAVGTKIATIVDLSSMDVEVGIPTNQIGAVKVGQTVDLQVEGFGERIFQAEVTRINPVAQSGTRTVPVYISLPNPDSRLSGGMFATGTITVQEAKDTLALPKSAIREDGDGAYVFAVEDGVLARKPIKVGQAWDDGNLVAIDSGVSAGETVVVAPLPGLTAGTTVTLDQA